MDIEVPLSYAQMTLQKTKYTEGQYYFRFGVSIAMVVVPTTARELPAWSDVMVTTFFAITCMARGTSNSI